MLDIHTGEREMIPEVRRRALEGYLAKASEKSDIPFKLMERRDFSVSVYDGKNLLIDSGLAARTPVPGDSPEAVRAFEVFIEDLFEQAKLYSQGFDRWQVWDARADSFKDRIEDFLLLSDLLSSGQYGVLTGNGANIGLSAVQADSPSYHYLRTLRLHNSLRELWETQPTHPYLRRFRSNGHRFPFEAPFQTNWLVTIDEAHKIFEMFRNSETSVNEMDSLLKAAGYRLKVSFVIGIYHEKARLMPYDRHLNPTGEDALRVKIKQLEEIYRDKNIDWEILYVSRDAADIDRSGAVVQELLSSPDLKDYAGKKVRVLDLPDDGLPVHDGKGSQVRFGMQEAIRSADVVAVTDNDQAVDMRLLAGRYVRDVVVDEKGALRMDAAGKLDSKVVVNGSRYANPEQKSQLYTAVGFEDFALPVGIDPLFGEADAVKVATRKWVTEPFFFVDLRSAGLSDTQVGAKVFPAELLGEVLPQAREERFSYETELFTLLERKGATFIEKPILWTDSPENSNLNTPLGRWLNFIDWINQYKALNPQERVLSDAHLELLENIARSAVEISRAGGSTLNYVDSMEKLVATDFSESYLAYPAQLIAERDPSQIAKAEINFEKYLKDIGKPYVLVPREGRALARYNPESKRHEIDEVLALIAPEYNSEELSSKQFKLFVEELFRVVTPEAAYYNLSDTSRHFSAEPRRAAQLVQFFERHADQISITKPEYLAAIRDAAAGTSVRFETRSADLAQAMKTSYAELVAKAQDLLNFMSRLPAENAAANFTASDVGRFNPVILAFGNPSPESFVAAAKEWQRVNALYQAKYPGFQVPVVISTGFGRGTQRLIDRTQAYYDETDAAKAAAFNALRAEQGIKLTEAKVGAFIMTQAGVPAGVITLEERSTNTFENIRESVPLIEKNILDRFPERATTTPKVAVITAAFHEPRVLLASLFAMRPRGWQVTGPTLIVPDLASMRPDQVEAEMEFLLGVPEGLGDDSSLRGSEFERIQRAGSEWSQTRFPQGLQALDMRALAPWDLDRVASLRDGAYRAYLGSKAAVVAEQAKRGEQALARTSSMLNGIGREDVAQIVRDLYLLALPYNIDGLRVAVVQHHMQTVEFMAEIMLGESKTDQALLKLGLVAALLHDVGNRIGGTLTKGRKAEFMADTRLQEVLAKHWPTEEAKKSALQKAIDAIIQPAIGYRTSHMKLGSQIALRILTDYNRERGMGVFSGEDIAEIQRLISIHDNPSVEEYERIRAGLYGKYGIPVPAERSAGAYLIDSKDVLAMYLREADRVTMVSVEDIDNEVANARAKKSGITGAEVFVRNRGRFFEEAALYGLAFGLGIAVAYGFINGSLFRTLAGWNIFKRLEKQARETYGVSVEELKPRSELRVTADQAGEARRMKSALTGVQEARLSMTLNEIFRNVKAQGVEDQLVAKILNFATDSQVMGVMNHVRADQGIAPVVTANVVGPKLQIVKGFDSEMLTELASRSREGVEIVVVVASGADVRVAEAFLKILNLKIEVTAKSVSEILDLKLKSRRLSRQSVTQILGHQTIDKKTYAQLLAGSAELGVVVAGEENPLAGVTQFLNVSEVVSAAFEVVQALAKSA
ncbi:MAG: ElyC/SanA/YdcF family protein [Candidatus Omnitrophica bacterium]|nr:ElyC/SanA/YdcF family protein [Candidatus Omnitrophota bacterium]